jgi:hypothetical protein
MTRKTLGFIPLIWQCAFCDTQNPGPIKSCTSCGAPQPEDVEFLQVDEERFNFIKDEALIRMAQAGPDIHCPFCGTRNLATAETCKKCGGDLSWDGKQRASGQRVPTVAEAQARRATTPPAPEPTQKRKAPTAAILIISLAVIVGCIILLIMLLRTDDVTATVSDLQWERSVAIEAYTNVTDSDWRDQVPANAEVTSCSMIYRSTSGQPQVNATEVCGEPYVEDTGTGIGEVVQDCEYEVYDDYCEYTMMAWVVVGTVTETGRDQSPFWPALNLEPDQREGDRSETYTIVFRDGGDSYRYTTSDERIFSRAELGSRWTLQINQLGGVQALEPAN